MRLLLIDDEAPFAESLSFHLKKARYLVDIALDGPSGLDMATSKAYDLVILDRMLPEMDGVELLRKLRARKVTTPVLFLTAKDTVANRVEGLDAGADDYLIKPFATAELLARIRALSRRAEPFVEDKLQTGSLVLSPQRREAYCEGTAIKLSFKEAQLLEILMKNRGIVIGKERIFEKIWGLAPDVEFNNVDTHICNLRKKLGVINSGVDIITIRNVGYCLETKSHE